MPTIYHVNPGASDWIAEGYGSVPMDRDGRYFLVETEHPESDIARETRLGKPVEEILYADEDGERTIESGKMEVMKGYTFGVLNWGFVEYQDSMGSDADIAAAAHTSYTGQKRKGTDSGLLRYLWRNRHTTPFEMAQLKLRLYIPIFVYRQLFRHRTASQLEMGGDMISNDTAFGMYSVQNEMSGRYVELPDHYFLPERWTITPQSKSNKQGRENQGFDSDEQRVFQNNMRADQDILRMAYEGRMEQGVAKEMARVNVPLSQYTLLTWRIDLKNLLHFLSLRLHAHAQFEVRQYAIAIYEIVKSLWPETAAAFEEYTLGAVTFSKQEIDLLREALILEPEGRTLRSDLFDAYCQRVENKRERAEFSTKLGF